MAKVAGYGGDVTLGSTALQVTEWSGDYEAEKIDITNKGSGAWKESMVGVASMSGSFTAVWDSTINSSAPPHAIAHPQSGVTMVLSIGASAGFGKYSFTGTIDKMSIKSAVMGAVEYTCSFESSGAVTFATT